MTRTTSPAARIAALSVAALALSTTLAACGGRDAGDANAGATAGATTAVVGATTAPVGGSTAATGATTAAAPASGALLDPNTATRDQLAAIPGLEGGLADSLVAKRPYADMRAVDKMLAGRLGEQQRDTVYTRLFKPIDLNSASKEEIELIPGVGPRMRHEFEEYRPYKNIEQFRREIGKYVDKNEVARLERYVTIK
jgi:DNA uptake protein ComE-like DNA-binding protein